MFDMTEQNKDPLSGENTSQENNENISPIDPSTAQGESSAQHDDLSALAGDDHAMFTDESLGGIDHSARIAELETALAAEKERGLRALAEAENTRRRAIKDREDAGKFAISRFARDLLDVLDNFARAMDAVPEDLKEVDERINGVVSGVESVQNDMLKIFSAHGIQKIEPLDEKFDANFHEVMFEAPGSGKPEGMIIQVMEPGYVISGRLLRPARVAVAKGDANASPVGNEIDQEV
jgi:molecular chaperone GrpE|tara:strand:+ start:90965 stop:91672 length:708 start_codon:yes stop_codon:yes gene_type:complete